MNKDGLLASKAVADSLFCFTTSPSIQVKWVHEDENSDYMNSPCVIDDDKKVFICFPGSAYPTSFGLSTKRGENNQTEVNKGTGLVVNINTGAQISHINGLDNVMASFISKDSMVLYHDFVISGFVRSGF